MKLARHGAARHGTSRTTAGCRSGRHVAVKTDYEVELAVVIGRQVRYLDQMAYVRADISDGVSVRAAVATAPPRLRAKG
jgi:2-keto-4-pentenoate hydratase/2-oxohepta-3-ene-1,7-dioic acid hydratase in catechol pathway